MKKIIATLLAAILMISSFAVMSSALTLEEFQAKYDPTSEQVTFLFDTAGVCSMGTLHQGRMEKIDDGNYKNMYAVTAEEFRPDRYVQLPGSICTVDGYAANWNLVSDLRDSSGNALLPTGATYPSATVFQIPNKAELAGRIILFRAQITPVETESVLGKILVVFAKIIKALFGEDTARSFLQVFVDMDLGLNIDIDAVFPPKDSDPVNP